MKKREKLWLIIAVLACAAIIAGIAFYQNSRPEKAVSDKHDEVGNEQEESSMQTEESVGIVQGESGQTGENSSDDISEATSEDASGTGAQATDGGTLSMYVQEVSITSSGAEFVIDNGTSDKEYFYGEMYGIEKETSEGWQVLEPKEELMWIEIAYIIASGEQNSFGLDWSFGYGELEAGNYRLVKTAYDNDGQEVILYAEFEVN